MTKRFVLYAFAVLALIATGCKKDKNDPVATRDAKEITATSAVLYGHVNPVDLKSSTELGILVSKSENPDMGNSKKYVASVVDKKNVFHVEATKLEPETKYYYTGYITIGAASYVGKTKSFTTKEGNGEENNGDDNDDDNGNGNGNYTGPIKQGRWDAYLGEILHQCLIFEDTRVVLYDFRGGNRIKGIYSYDNNRLIINPVEEWWGIYYSYSNWPDDYNWIDPNTLEPIQNEYCAGWHEDNLDQLNNQLLYWNSSWWLDREFILDSSTTAHGHDEGDVNSIDYDLVYKYRP